MFLVTDNRKNGAMREFFKKTVVKILSFESWIVLRKYKPRIIGVTGSVGKTSTKDAIFTVLSAFYHIRQSEKSFNSDTGVPLSILGVPNGWTNPLLWLKNIGTGLWLIIYPCIYPKWLVLEIGADRPGDIKKLAKWIKPEVTVLTRFPDIPGHIEFFESREHVIAEKRSLAEALSKDGLLVLNADDERVLEVRDKILARVVTYGFSDKSMLRAMDERFVYDEKDGLIIPRGLSFMLAYNETMIPVSMPHIIGVNHVYSILAALAIAYKEGLDMEHAVKAAMQYIPPPGRLSLIEGMHDSFIIDDTYNSSPVAAIAALDLLKSMRASGRKIAVLGDMLELGKYTLQAHKDLGKLVASSAEILITVGARAETVGEHAFGYGMTADNVKHFVDSREAGEYLRTIIKRGDLVLVKGSQGVRLERVVEAVMEHPEYKEHMLVRQEKEWEKR